MRVQDGRDPTGAWIKIDRSTLNLNPGTVLCESGRQRSDGGAAIARCPGAMPVSRSSATDGNSKALSAPPDRT
ncbi:hypothetical protein NHU_03065 [Rhodovulum sulfidophilum]|uniref:Uncharacterized protein n=1 Tax=Rhodovulum sulfidophilum TaxID=35806 RepID=A0A0D6B685_RHOSU|nr:hypothetical protein NHU_03065 [Rhodovulum sulfidophilum]